MSVHKVSSWALPSPFTVPRDAPYPLPPAIQPRSNKSRVSSGGKGKLAKIVETNASILARERIARQREEIATRQSWGGTQVWIGGREPEPAERPWVKGPTVAGGGADGFDRRMVPPPRGGLGSRGVISSSPIGSKEVGPFSRRTPTAALMKLNR
jgi:hypothetical protein